MDSNIFSKKPEKDLEKIRDDNPLLKDRFIFFWNNRNARRKQTGTLVHWYRNFLDLDHVDRNKVCLFLHTDPDDPHGQPVRYLVDQLGFEPGEVFLSTDKMPADHLSLLYNIADCTINISDAEGFGLATLESLSCETPIIVNMTGGLQEQVTDGENWFGIGIEPCSKAIIGSQQVPYIYEDRISEDDFLNALTEMYNKTPEELSELGKLGRQHVETNYNFETFSKQWQDLMLRTYETYGSWSTRKKNSNIRVEAL